MLRMNADAEFVDDFVGRLDRSPRRRLNCGSARRRAQRCLATAALSLSGRVSL